MNNSLYPKYYLAPYDSSGEWIVEIPQDVVDMAPTKTPPLIPVEATIPGYPTIFPFTPTPPTPPPPLTPPTTPTTPTALAKKIYKLDIFRNIYGEFVKNVAAIGESRVIEITGTPGSMFSLTINKSDGSSMLADSIENVIIPGEGGIGKYTFTQRFPSTKKEESYEVTLIPCAGVLLSDSVPITTPTYSIKQYVNPIITFTNKATIAVDIPTVYTVTGKSATSASKNVTISWTIDRSEGSSGYLYVKKQPHDLDNWVSNKLITKKSSCDQEHDIIKIAPSTVNIKEGMRFTSKTVINKLVISGNETAIRSRVETVTNVLKLNNVDDLEVGMIMTYSGIKNLVSILTVEEHCNSITISSNEVVKNNSILTFVKNNGGRVKEVIDNFHIKTENPIKLITGASLTFNRYYATQFYGSLTSTSGVTSPVISGTLTVSYFGEENETYTQNLDNILTYTPNAWGQTVQVTKNTLKEINVLGPDTDENYRVKTPAIVANPSHGTLSGSDFAAGIGTIDYTPTTGFTGADLFTFKVSDGTTDSDTKTIYITVK